MSLRQENTGTEFNIHPDPLPGENLWAVAQKGGSETGSSSVTELRIRDQILEFSRPLGLVGERREL